MIVLLQGGTSSEREVSLKTAASVATCLNALGIAYQAIDPQSPDWLEKIEQLKPEVVFIALHGQFGEDGEAQALLEGRGIKHTGSNAAVSALAFNKISTIKALKELSLTQPQSEFFEKGEQIVTPNLPFPLVVKPASEGSSYGVSICNQPADFSQAVTEAFKYDHQIMVQEYIQGVEVTCGVINTFGALQALPIVEILPKTAFFDYEAKYNAASCQEICPARLKPELTAQIQNQSLEIFQTLKLGQYARIDWIVKDQKPYFLEVNTIPGMTQTSLIVKELAAAGITLEKFVNSLLQTAT